MMHRDLSIIDILKFASENHSLSEVVSLRTEGDMHRYNIVSPPWHGTAIGIWSCIMG